MTIEDRVLLLGKNFENRLIESKLNAALDYVRYNECGVALELLCDYVCEENVEISQSEFNQIMEIGKELNVRWHESQLIFIKKLILQQ